MLFLTPSKNLKKVNNYEIYFSRNYSTKNIIIKEMIIRNLHNY